MSLECCYSRSLDNSSEMSSSGPASGNPMNSSGLPALRRSFCSCSRCRTSCSILSCLFCLNACFSSLAFFAFCSSAAAALFAWRACASRVRLKASLSSFSMSISLLSVDWPSCFCQLPLAAGLSP